MSQHELSEYAEATGTLLNAYTSREHTSYYFQGRRDNTEKLVEILADVIQKPDLSRYSYKQLYLVYNRSLTVLHKAHSITVITRYSGQIFIQNN